MAWLLSNLPTAESKGVFCASGKRLPSRTFGNPGGSPYPLRYFRSPENRGNDVIINDDDIRNFFYIHGILHYLCWNCVTFTGNALVIEFCFTMIQVLIFFNISWMSFVTPPGTLCFFSWKLLRFRRDDSAPGEHGQGKPTYILGGGAWFWRNNPALREGNRR